MEEEKIHALRARIDAVDQEILVLLARRSALGNAIGSGKRELGLPILQPEREASLLAARERQARALGLDPGWVRQLFEAVLTASRSSQQATRDAQGNVP